MIIWESNKIFIAICGLLLALYGQIMLVSSECAGTWDPFCKAEGFYEPYITIWKGGATKQLVRHRGPGYIDTSKMSDIYICTNGLVMHYYAKTKTDADLLEEGELTWIPHHCALYNPTCGPGSIQRTQRLQGLLLIGHPKDYREPALQMFTAPYYDMGWDHPPREGYGWMNLTSLIMISTEGECLISKGASGEAIVRIQVNHPEAPKPELKEHLDHPKFCRIDATQYMGESNDYDPIAILSQVDDVPMDLQEARTKNIRNIKTGAFIWLSDDMEFNFKGCLRYPLFSMKTHDIILKNVAKYSDPTNKLFKSLELIDEYSPNPDNAEDIRSKFWDTEIRGKRRSEREEYNVKEAPHEDSKVEQAYQEAKATYEKALEELITKKKEKAGEEEIAKLKEEEEVAYFSYHIFHFLQEFRKLRDHTTAQLENNLKVKWNQTKEVMDEHNLTALYQDYTEKVTKREKLVYELFQRPYDMNISLEIDEIEKEIADTEKQLRKGGRLLNRAISIVEVLTTNYWRHRNVLSRIKDKFFRAVRAVEKRKPPKYVKTEWPATDQIVSMVNLRVYKSEDTLDYRICDILPKPRDTCKRVKPTGEEAGLLLSAADGKVPEWETQDAWRDKVLTLIQEIFVAACPYLPDTAGFAKSISNIFKAYLLAMPPPAYAVHNETNRRNVMDANHTYYSYIYNETILLYPNLTEMRPLWDPLLDSLELCAKKVEPMEFYASLESPGSATPDIFLRKLNVNNGTYREYNVDELLMMEQADMDYQLNWAIDMQWKMFSTALGICMEFYYDKIGLVNSHLYGLFNEDFLHPLRQNWINNRHNVIFRQIFGQYYASGKADRWVNTCLESSFVRGGDVSYRPLRWLLVNSFSELNFFRSGPMAGTTGFYFQ